MPTDVVMPQMGESITEGTLTKWLKKVGDTVQRDEPLFEISTDKVDAEIPSPAAGTLQEIKIAEGATVQINTVVAVIGGEAQPAHRSAQLRETAAAPAADTVTPAAVDSPAANETPAEPSSQLSGSRRSRPRHRSPDAADGRVHHRGTITKWLKKVGDTVERDEPHLRDLDRQSRRRDSLARRRHADRDQGAGRRDRQHQHRRRRHRRRRRQACAPHPQPLRLPQPPAPAPAARRLPRLPQPPLSVRRRAPRSSPLVRKIAKDNNVDLAQVPGTGSAGRITKDDILGHLEKPPQPQAAAPAAPAAAAAAPPRPAAPPPLPCPASSSP